MPLKAKMIAKTALFMLPAVFLAVSPRLVLISGLCVLIYAVAVMLSFRPIISNRVVWAYFFCASLLLSVSMLMPDVYEYGISKGLYFIFIILPLGVLAVTLMETPDDIRYMLWGFIALGSIISLVSVFVTPYPLGNDRYQWQGNICSIAAVVLLQFWVIKNKPVALAFASLNIAGVFISSSKQSMVVLIAGVLFYFVLKFISLIKTRGLSRKIFAEVLTIILFVSGAIAYFSYSGNDKFSFALYRVRRLLFEGYIGDRGELLRYGWELFLKNPFLGAGIGQYEKYKVNYSYPHNIFLELLSEFGVLGVIVLLLPLFYAGYRMVVITFRSNNQAFSHILLLFISFFVVANISWDIVSLRPLWVFGIMMLNYMNVKSRDFGTQGLPEKGRTP